MFYKNGLEIRKNHQKIHPFRLVLTGLNQNLFKCLSGRAPKCYLPAKPISGFFKNAYHRGIVKVSIPFNAVYIISQSVRLDMIEYSLRQTFTQMFFRYRYPVHDYKIRMGYP